MKTGRASRTAHLVAFGRAVANLGISHIPGFQDPTARFFLTEQGTKSLTKIEQLLATGKPSTQLEMAGRMGDFIGLRTSAIDAAVRHAVSDGATQLVILGAGFDGRAWRMPELAGITVFEVDHPATQRDKQARVANLPTARGSVHFVPIDFERESLDAVLERAGHDRSSRTCWIWEGVVMYLTRDAMLQTLAGIAGRSTAGSTLIVNYHTAHRRFLMRIIFRLIGEPQISAWSPQEMAADLASAGFAVREDSGMTDWNAAFAGGNAKIDRARYMRIAVARRS